MISNVRLFLLSLLQTLKASFWLIPICMLVGALILAFLIVEIDLQIIAGGYDIWPELRLSVAGAREIVSTIAGSMITVASLVFSMTLVALSLVTQQLGPRILQIFMEDRPTQIMLGLFIATFVFAMVVLGAIGIGQANEFVPKLSVAVAGGLAIVAFTSVILFVHHIARNIQADVVIFNISQKLQHAEEALSNNDKDNAREVEPEQFERILAKLEGRARTISLSHASGYVQYVDNQGALSVAKEHGLTIALRCRPGHFILKGRPLLIAAPASEIDDELAEKLEQIVQIGSQRTRVQRVEFEMLALVEIALRALSKGINDPFTAISCIDRISEGLAKIMKYHPDFQILYGENDTPRVLSYPQTFEHFLKKTCEPILNAAADIPLVLDRLEHMLEELKALGAREKRINAIDEQLAKLNNLQQKASLPTG